MENYPLSAHLDHPWIREGRCVYCMTCGIRLYQGKVPKDRQQKEAFVTVLDAAIARALEQHA